MRIFFLSIFFSGGGGGIFNSKYIWGKGYAWYACFLARGEWWW